MFLLLFLFFYITQKQLHRSDKNFEVHLLYVRQLIIMNDWKIKDHNLNAVH